VLLDIHCVLVLKLYFANTFEKPLESILSSFDQFKKNHIIIHLLVDPSETFIFDKLLFARRGLVRSNIFLFFPYRFNSLD